MVALALVLALASPRCPTPAEWSADAPLLLASGCVVGVEVVALPVDTYARLRGALAGSRAEATALRIEVERLRGELARTRVMATGALREAAGALSAECPQCPRCDCPVLRPLLAGVVAGAVVVGGAWIGVASE